ncbi:MAG TPA: dUTP diphosphatase [Hyphomicrobium sp.]|jgi:dUTP pyrophosphatase|uniref:dUTP diphosphatase n=1 Tax=Hyphomicrobium sp. TaxID=82 RepID=UPI002C4E9197|nr:dUTP diphosphatase [Hyphomicrobium sp.]HXE02095.1 dUTP diphosphatase [Hyphomicrobium sp.]
MTRRDVAKIKIKVRRLEHAEGLPLPAYQSSGAAGFDLVAAVPADSPVVLAPGGRGLVPTGLIFELPPGSEAQVRPRSGLAVKFGVTVLNSPGTIDADYRGEIAVILVNLGDAPFVVNRGERIAQVIVAPVTRVALRQTNKLSATVRSTGGFGSTGTGTTPSFTKTKKKDIVPNRTKRRQTKSPSPRKTPGR